MAQAEASLDTLGGLPEVLRLVIQIEDSEINRVFVGIVQASGSEFVRRMRPFQVALAEHIAFICEEIPKLEADLADPCRELAERHLVGSR